MTDPTPTPPELDLAARVETLERQLAAEKSRAGHAITAGREPLLAQIDELKEENDDYEKISDRMAKILRETATALKGEPDARSMHSWHDLAKVADALIARGEEQAGESYLHEVAAKEATARAEAAEAKIAAVRKHCEGAEWMTDENGDQWQVVTTGVLFNALGDGA